MSAYARLEVHSLYQAQIMAFILLCVSIIACEEEDTSKVDPKVAKASEVAQSLGLDIPKPKQEISPRGCEGEPVCASQGLCGRNAEGMCVALTPKGCLQSKKCKKTGACTPQDGLCVVVSDLDCQQSERCASFGICTAQNGECIVTQERDCERSQVCRELGKCKLMNNQCVTQELWSEGCGPYCLRARDTCVCSPPPKRRKPPVQNIACLGECSRDGLCELTERGCKALDDKMCQRSEVCLMHGRCKAEGGECVVSDTGCIESLSCKILGLCDVSPMVEGRKWRSCVATRENMCRKSLACQKVGLCEFAPRAKPEDQESLSAGIMIIEGSDMGASKPEKKKPTNYFSATEDEVKDIGDCVFSTKNKSCKGVCERLGRCSPNTVGTCVALMDAECRLSEVCKRYGRCSAQNGECIAKTNSDCRRGQNCKMFGYCSAQNGACINDKE